ncbi:MAG: beta-CASP ribonuclease aCPSF1 [Candidatus Aenigmatarchaeota archaeon]
MKIIDEVKDGLPSDAMISEVCFEGSDIVLYTKNKDMFKRNGDFIKRLVKKLKKRIELRPDPSIRKDEETAKEKIEDISPEEAGIEEMTFQPGFGKVIIEALKPGLVIGKGGSTLDKIKKETMWKPQVKIAPAISSDVVDTVRKVLYQESEWRKEFLNDIGERIHSKEVDEVDWARISCLGGCREVGRSSFMLQTPDSRIMIDCGIKPGNTHEYPYLQVPEGDISSIDAVVVSHPHLDHVGFIPYLYEYGYEGPLYLTSAARDLMVLLCLDYLDVAKREGHDVPYSSKSVEKAVKHSIALDYDHVSDITPDVGLTFQNAGHILGSALAHFHIGEGDHNLVYTGDYNFGESKLFNKASTNFQRIETMITESTYGENDAIQPSREEAERKLLNCIKKTIDRGGKVLIPSFAVGRAQDIMCILDEEDRNDGLDVPVYLEGMMWDATAIHTTYPEDLNKDLQHQIFHKDHNPFTSDIFQRVGSREEREEVISSPDPAVVMSTSGMLTGGPVMEYLKEFAADEKNMLLFVGYQAEGTMGRRIQKGWDEIPVEREGKRKMVELNLEVETVDGLSGHSDRNQIINFINALESKPNKILTVHGDENSCIQMARTLHNIFNRETIPPKNLETLRLK